VEKALKRWLLPGGGHTRIAGLKSHGEMPMPDADLTLVRAGGKYAGAARGDRALQGARAWR
jgi:hypothetical protein